MSPRSVTDGADDHSDLDVAEVAGQVPISPFTVADVRRLEAMGLLDACGTLHREGILDDREYEAKRVELAGGLAVVVVDHVWE